MNNQITEIAIEVGYLMGENQEVFTADSQDVIQQIAEAAEAFKCSDGGDYTEELQAYASDIHNRLVSEGDIGRVSLP